MKEYTVKCSGSITITVEAEDEDSAMVKASEEAEINYTAHDIINDYKVESVEDITDD